MDLALFAAFDESSDGMKRAGTDASVTAASKRARTDIIIQAPKLVGLPAAQESNADTEAEYADPTGKTCKHEVAMPLGRDPDVEMLALTVPADEIPARTYKFELDPFQKAAVACITRDESVLVSAHTSAGKTVVAEYAIATSLKAKQRVLYTSPIKALSNQKYRELKEAFEDVGLMTGDVTIDVDASCLVMTTEILRSMLYRGSEVMREVKWVIFDEVHYMRDKERGVVWEEVMILLPHSVRYVMLSATVPNALEFAQWIAQLHSQPCHVVYTGYRPTPLMHYICPQGAEGMHLVVDSKGVFKSDQFNKAIAAIKPKPRNARAEEADGKGGGKGRGKGARGRERNEPSECFKLVQLVVSKGCEPLIVFAFGKARCEALAKQMTKLHLNTTDETSMVETIFQNATGTCMVEQSYQPSGRIPIPSQHTQSSSSCIYIVCLTATLTEDDQGLPQVLNLLPMIRRGIAVHHSGLLPVLKELVEVSAVVELFLHLNVCDPSNGHVCSLRASDTFSHIPQHIQFCMPVHCRISQILFAENLVKVLFATETFAMGLNMPARTVLFAEQSKFDGEGFRYLTSGEYIQMSGRAGRRGLDTQGLVIQMVDDRTDTAKIREMLTGRADTLSSRFHLSYNMLLNCVRVETADVEMLIQKSFYTFQQQAALPHLQAHQKRLLTHLSSADMQVANLEACTELHALIYSELTLRDELRLVLNLPAYALPYMQSGRLVAIRAPVPSSTSAAGGELGVDWGWGVLVNYKRKDVNAPLATAATEKKSKERRGAKSDAALPGGSTDEYTVEVLLRCAIGTEAALACGETGSPPPAQGDILASSEVHVLTLPLAHIDRFSSARVKLPPDLRSDDARYSVAKLLGEIDGRFPDGIPLLSPVDDMKVEERLVSSVLRKLETTQARIAEPHLATNELRSQLPTFRKRLEVAAEERRIRKHIKEVEAVLMQDELKGMRRVLRKLGHLSEDGVIQNKGRVACEVSTADELLTTELVFSGLLNELEPGNLAALLSVLVCEGGASKRAQSGDDPKKSQVKGDKGGGSKARANALDAISLIRTKSMVEPFEKLREHARHVATTVEEAKLSIDVTAYVDNLSVALIDVVVEWCGGAKFAEVMEYAGDGMYEGSIIRSLHRLEELLRQLIDASKVVGNEELETRCETARKLLIRDVVFAASLYT